MKKNFLFLFLFSQLAFAGNYLTQEMETLRRDLPSDDPSRRELTLRLADMYFDISIKDDPENLSLKDDRERSLALYQEALKGEDGFSPLQGETRLKVIFQTARLQDKLARKDKAETLFRELHGTTQVPRNLKLEASLYLGESSEDKAKLKDATIFYKEAIALCTSVDTCNFAHYRLGWTYFKETKLDEAISEINLALWDARGDLRDQVVNDLISFMSQRQTDGKKELKEIEAIIGKSKNPQLMSQMAETFYLAGNREAGSFILSHINKKSPSLYNEIRLLEESYGFRKWDDVDSHLNALSKRSIKDLPTEATEKDEALKIHRRLIVQLDAEVETNPQHAEYLKRSIDLYLSFYPADEMRMKMQEGWLKVENDNDAKIARLGVWINEYVKMVAPKKDIENLRRTRLSLAQKQNNSEVVILEARALAQTAESQSDVREYNYVAAYELNKTKKFEDAEIIFKKLVDESLAKGTSDQWMIQSQNLLLDNYNTRRDYGAISASVSTWTSHPSMKDRKDLQDEFLQMKTIATQASFEKAVAAGDSKDSLELFFQNCTQKILVPQSCENAKVLSVKLKDQAKLVALLELNQDATALMNEYELMGRFSDAARLREKVLTTKSPMTDYLRVSLLYELDMDFKERNRILNALLLNSKGSKIDPKFEKALYVTLAESEMIDDRTLGLNWSLPFKMKIAQAVENAQSKKMLLQEKTFQGPVWSKVVLEEMQKLDDAQRKISFYGGNSKVMFQRKMDMISRYENQLNSYLQGADGQTRVYLLSMIGKTHGDFSEAILNTPIPAELDAATVEQVKAHLAQMAAPYSKASEDYKNLLTEELAAIEDRVLAAKITSNLASREIARYSSYVDVAPDLATKTAVLDYSGRKSGMDKLRLEPSSVEALTSLENFYLTNKSERIASYFKERIQLLKN